MVIITDEGDVSTRTPMASLQLMKVLDKPENPPSLQSRDSSREFIDQLRLSAMETKTVFTYCFVAKSTWSSLCFGCILSMIAIFIQTAIPIAIVVTEQPLADITEEPRGCPMRADVFTKISSCILSLLFVVQIVSLCLNKLRGLLFLRYFVNLGLTRRICLDVGMLSQVVGMAAAGGAQFLLFVGNGGKDYTILLLQSLAMQFTLTVDMNMISALVGRWTSSRLNKISANELLCDGAGVGEMGGIMPDVTYKRLSRLIVLENMGLIFIASTGVIWSIALTICI